MPAQRSKSKDNPPLPVLRTSPRRNASHKREERLLPPLAQVSPSHSAGRAATMEILAPETERETFKPHKAFNSESITPSERLATQALRKHLPLCDLKDLHRCEEGCRWRWFVHTLLSDVAVFKQGFDDCNEGLQQKEDCRKELADVAAWRLQIQEEFVVIDAALVELEAEGPLLTSKLEELSQQASEQRKRRKDLEAKRDLLSAAFKMRSARMADMELLVKNSNHSGSESTKAAEELTKRLYRIQGEIESVTAEYQRLVIHRDHLREQAHKDGIVLEVRVPVTDKERSPTKGMTQSVLQADLDFSEAA